MRPLSAFLLIAFLGTVAQAQESADQQRCILELNNGLQKLLATQWTQTTKCLRDAAKGRLAGSIDDCIAGDAGGKRAKQRAKLIASTTVKCTQLPDLGPTQASLDVAPGAVQGVVRGMFGPSLDDGISPSAADPIGAKCQTAVIKAVSNCQTAIVQEFNRCKKSALKGSNGAAVTSAQDLQDRCMGTGLNGMPDASGKIAKACDATSGALARAVSKSCPSDAPALATAFLGCAGTSPQGVSACLAQVAQCQTCRALNRADGLNRDCDALDNGALDSSCGESPAPALQVSVITSQQTYTPGQTVTVFVVVASTFAISNATLTITALDTSPSAGSDGVIYEQTFPISVVAATTTPQLVQFAGSRVGSYILQAQLATSRTLAEGSAQFGIQVPMGSLPSTILRASVATIDVPAVRAQLAQAATSAAPVTLQLGGESFTMKVAPVNAFQLDPGETLPPHLAEAEAYQGQLCATGSTQGCVTDAQSRAIFTIGGSMTGQPLFAMVAKAPDDALWVEPLARYDSTSVGSGQHVLYHSRDVASPPEPHLEPPSFSSVEADRRRIGLFPSIGPLPKCLGLFHVTVALRVYSQKTNILLLSGADDMARMFVLYVFRAIMTNELVDIVPRDSFALLTVDNVVIKSWRSIGESTYRGICQLALRDFAETEHYSNALANYVLFTPGDAIGCDGYGYLGGTYSPLFQRWATWTYAIANQDGDLVNTVTTVAQEVGHNWDWHGLAPDNWRFDEQGSVLSPHDPHTSPLISESWIEAEEGGDGRYRDFRHCTIMQASYNGCGRPELRYHRTDYTSLQHLALGLCAMYAPGPLCGDLVCDPQNEDADTCCFDCGCSVGKSCAGPPPGTCVIAPPTPTPTPIVIPPSCGDGVCNAAETCVSCAADCGTCPLPPLCPGVCTLGVHFNCCQSDYQCQTVYGNFPNGRCTAGSGCCDFPPG